MYIPRPVIFAFLIAISAVAGWVLNGVLEGEAPVALASDVQETPQQPSPQAGTTSIFLPEQAPPTIQLTIVTPPSGAPATNTVARQASPSAGASGQPAVATPGRTTAQPGAGATSQVGPSQTASGATHGTGTVSLAPRATSPGGAVSLQITPETAITGIGEHIVIAYDGSIVYVGDNGQLTANTGDASMGGIVALDAESSSLSSSYAPPVLIAGPGQIAGAAPGAGTSTASSTAAPGVVAGGSYAGLPSDVSPLVSAFSLYTKDRTADIAGFEDHSVLVRGLANVVTYDDSNVFVNRDGKINANTGDTDSAGLNAVAVLRSIVSAGPHCDDGCDDESIIQAEAGVFDEGDVAIDGDGHVVWAPDAPAESPSDDDSDDDSVPEDNGDDEDSEGDESPDGDVSDPEEPEETREEADSTRPAADTGVDPVGTPAAGSLTVGGDGIDDLSLRVDGVGNVSSYDDSNVVVGGTGDVNAQIGDSDTGGTVVMDVVDSRVSGGNSR